jgi:hypothetical protein
VPRFYFNVNGGDFHWTDVVGRRCTDLVAARSGATVIAGEMITSLAAGEMLEDAAIEVEDQWSAAGARGALAPRRLLNIRVKACPKKRPGHVAVTRAQFRAASAKGGPATLDPKDRAGMVGIGFAKSVNNAPTICRAERQTSVRASAISARTVRDARQ